MDEITMRASSPNQQTPLSSMSQGQVHPYSSSHHGYSPSSHCKLPSPPSPVFINNKNTIRTSLVSTLKIKDIVDLATPRESMSTGEGYQQRQTSIVINEDTSCTETPLSPGHQFVFKKPVYNHHYHATHYHHLERHDSIFQELKHLFKRNPRRSLLHHRTSSSSSVNDTSISDYSFGNEFNKDLEQRYGKWGAFVGNGSGGSVRIIRRTLDNKTFAVKEFRPRHAHESERSYIKKVTAEFCIGSTLHHANVIETLDIIQQGPSTFYEIMEYAPHDMFSVVMRSKMSSEEIGCFWRQLLNGVAYLQTMGIGHRDLKLDNLVVDQYNVVKVIDFGTATVVRYPFDKVERQSSGVCGSDPYIAPEQYKGEYNAFMADMWSCGIIFVCMVIRRFAWRIPRASIDKNYQLYLHNRNNLLAYIPRYARPAIAHLLTPDPSQRCSMETLLSDPWVASISTCTCTIKAHQHCISPAST